MITTSTSTSIISPVLPTTTTIPTEVSIHDLGILKFTFICTYIILLTTATITIIEALRTKIPYIRHVLNLETAISLIAGYFYSIFVLKIEKYEENHVSIDWKEISKTRYIDWSITTPLMLITLCLVLGKQAIPSRVIHVPTILSIIGLNYIMLMIGYMGEINIIPKWIASTIGFLPFFGMYYLIFQYFVGWKAPSCCYILYGIYFIIWSMYGIVYLFNEENKNICMNILDLFAKCFIGLGLWAQYTKVIVI